MVELFALGLFLLGFAIGGWFFDRMDEPGDLW